MAAVKTVGRVVTHVSRTLVGAWDQDSIPTGCGDGPPTTTDPPTPALLTLRPGGGPALLDHPRIHCSIHGSFATLENDLSGTFTWHTEVEPRPSTTRPSPRPPDENANLLLDQLPKGARVGGGHHG